MRAASTFPLVCVGGSAGALDAYRRLLKHLAADLGIAVVIVSHRKKAAMTLHQVLSHYTSMPVELITDGLLIEPNRVYVLPENRELHVLDGRFRLKPS